MTHPWPDLGLLAGTCLISAFTTQVPQRPELEAPTLSLLERFYGTRSSNWLFSIYTRTCMKNRKYPIHNSIRKKFWTLSQNIQKGRVTFYRDNWDLDWNERHRQWQFSVLVLYELSAGFDIAGGSLFLKYSAHLASRYYFVLLLLVALFLFFCSPVSLVTPSRNPCWILHIPQTSNFGVS